MNRIGIAAVVLLCLAVVPLVDADTVIDPRIVIGADNYSIPVPGLNFAFSANNSGGGWLAGATGFFNDSGVDWSTLQITVATPYAENPNGQLQPIIDPALYTIICPFFYYNDLTVTRDLVTMNFYGVVPGKYPGILAGDHFFIGLNNDPSDISPDGTGGWLGAQGQALEFTAAANVPEPSTWLLLLGGLGVMIFFNRRRL